MYTGIFATEGIILIFYYECLANRKVVCRVFRVHARVTMEVTIYNTQ